ncbi:hypothetical protein [Sphingomonas sp. H160509]|uniref:hypothetical protein n=1 Tax=Sphingomonas sp. H160509 TaxID=2955313 RepID=UPI0031582E5D
MLLRITPVRGDGDPGAPIPTVHAVPPRDVGSHDELGDSGYRGIIRAGIGDPLLPQRLTVCA